MLRHLNVNIEIDDELPFSVKEPTPQTQTYHDHLASITPPTASVATLQTHTSQAPLVLNSKQALFFPISSQDGSIPGRARQRDVYDVIKDNGWNWRDPMVGFFRTGTEEDIRKRWRTIKAS